MPVARLFLYSFFLSVCALASFANVSAEEKRPWCLPFDVQVDGQKAVMKTGMDLFAVIEKPVKNNVIVRIDQKSPLFVIKAYRCQEDGTVLKGPSAGIIFKRNTDKVWLNTTMDRKPLPPGTYLLNVAAHGKTSRVVFTIADEDGEIKMPDLSKIHNFLRRKK